MPPSMAHRLRSHPATAAVQRKFNLPIYFQLRLQEITKPLEMTLAESDKAIQKKGEGVDAESAASATNGTARPPVPPPPPALTTTAVAGGDCRRRTPLPQRRCLPTAPREPLTPPPPPMPRACGYLARCCLRSVAGRPVADASGEAAAPTTTDWRVE